MEDVEQIWVRGALEKTIRDRGELYEKGPIIPWSETQAGFGLRPKADHKENKRSKNGVYAEKGYISSTAWVLHSHIHMLPTSLIKRCGKTVSEDSPFSTSAFTISLATSRNRHGPSYSLRLAILVTSKMICF